MGLVHDRAHATVGVSTCSASRSLDCEKAQMPAAESQCVVESCDDAHFVGSLAGAHTDSRG
jgi:hypothetical protein